jgi:hypothetical protein
MPPTNAKRQPDTLAQRFELEETFLSSPNAAALKSAVFAPSIVRTGDPVVLKYWEKTGIARADEVVAEVLASGESDDAFYITMPSDIAPLEYASRFARPDHWLRALHGPRQPALLWKNLRRLAEALGAVHGQGLAHGRKMVVQSIPPARQPRPTSASEDSSFAFGSPNSTRLPCGSSRKVVRSARSFFSSWTIGVPSAGFWRI